MAQELLNNLLNFANSPAEILEWLTSDDLNEEQWTKFNNICLRNEFTSFFLDYLREQFLSVLQNSNGLKQTPAKKVLLQQNSNVGKSVQKTVQNLQPENSLAKLQLDEQGESKKQVKVNATQQDLTTSDQSGIFKRCNLDKDNGTSIKSPKYHTPERNVLQRNPDSSQAVPATSPQTSTPITNKSNSSSKKRAQFITVHPSERQEINPLFKDSVVYEHNPGSSRREGRNISFDDNSFPSLGGRSSSSFNSSQNFGKNQSYDSTRSNLSPKSNISANNKILTSPVSPLCNNSASMLSPINSKAYQNRFHDSPSSNSFNQTTSTPERIGNNTSKSSKTTPRQNWSLSDFITTDTRSAKKSSGKKAHSKSWSKGDEQNTSNIISNTSADHSENKNINKNQKKLKPTRLNTMDTTDKENTVFGEISRPNDPQFVNVPIINKSIDTESLQIEKGLVLIERQKKPENSSNKIVTDEQAQPKWKILQRTPNKINKSTSTIIPDKTLVENIEVLDVLAELYSGFLDNNLVVNPMTELHFVINLITNQYIDDSKLVSLTTKNVEDKLHNCNAESIKDIKYEKKELSALKKSLNFDDVEENGLENNAKLNHDNDSQCTDKSANELGCSSLMDDTKDNLELINIKLKDIDLQINKKLDDIDVHIPQTTNNEDNIHKQVEAIESSSMTKERVKVYLNTPHNCVYFSTKVLNYQKDFLKCLNRATLKLLYENNQISLFQPELCKYLDKIYNMKVLESNKTKASLNIGIVELNVCFQIDTDNRENFPSSTAFQNFRKQRDMFYEILKIWEDNHLLPGWSFPITLNGKIKSMLALHTDVTNFTHFTRLFKSQMLISCIQSGQQDDLLDEETLSSLKNDREKWTNLNKKFVTPLSYNGPGPLSHFPGSQEFFKDFILHATNHMFYTYLENTFINEIMDLNNTQFAGSDIEDTETEVDEHTKSSFVICLSSLRLLAKFLGFLTSLPYRSETSKLEHVIASQIVLRSKCLPRVDLQYCLYDAVMLGKLSLTVPWIVEYLSMMDCASLRLPYYKKVLEILYCIYRVSNYRRAVANSEELMSQQTAVLLKLSIGSLFELPVFPTELYYSWQAKYDNKALKLICEKQQSIFDAEDSIISIKHSLFLDKLEIIDDRILYSCCPFLRTLNVLLTSGNSNVNNSTSYRHVTPVQLQKSKANIKHLEIQLEEAFFHGQSTSIRKTVEYVSERVGASCVKYISNNLLPVERQKICIALKRLVEENYGHLKDQPEILKTTLTKDLNAWSMNASKAIKEESDKSIPKICETRINQSIELLLADDCLKAVKEMCTKIATRMAMEKIDKWMQSHIVGGSTFIKDLDLELNKIIKDGEDAVVEKKYHNVNAASPTNILDGLREIIWNLMETGGQFLTAEILCQFLDQLYMCLTERSDLKAGHDLFTKGVQDKVYKVWKMDNLKLCESDSSLSRILSPRNIMLMSQSFNNFVWVNFGKFLNNLLKRSILTIESLSEQAVALFRREWPEKTSNNLATCLKQAISDYKSSDEETEKIRYLIGWVAGAHNNIECDGFNFNFD